MKSFKQKNAETLIKYIVLCAGEEINPFEQQLGAIHILKYVYLADLFYAKRFGGETFTGLNWKFHNFGPWSYELFSTIEPTLAGAGAVLDEYNSNFGEQDTKRWRLSDSDYLRVISQDIPACITRNLKKVIREFLKNTPELLDYVYNTEPMRRAAPEESLDFSFGSDEDKFAPVKLRVDALSNRKKKDFYQRMRALKQKQADGLIRKNKVETVKASPRYDEIYSEGIASFDNDSTLAEYDVLTVKFDDSVWKSEVRTKIND